MTPCDLRRLVACSLRAARVRLRRSVSAGLLAHQHDERPRGEDPIESQRMIHGLVDLASEHAVQREVGVASRPA